jgi:hypothetical protein
MLFGCKGGLFYTHPYKFRFPHEINGKRLSEVSFPEVNAPIDRKRVAAIAIIVLSVSMFSFLVFNRPLMATKIYDETAVVVEKNWDWMSRYTYILIPTPIGSVPKKDCKARQTQRLKISTSTGSEYEIDFVDDWQLIEINDIILQFNWSVTELNNKSNKPQLNSWVEPPENPCWLELWRNGEYLKDIKAYRII